MVGISKTTKESTPTNGGKEWVVPQLKKISLTDVTATGANPGNDGTGGHSLS